MNNKKNIIWENSIEKNWFYSIKREYIDWTIQETINDGLWLLLDKNQKDQLLYNKDALWISEKEKIKRWHNILKTTQKNLADALVWVDFKKPRRNIKIFQWDDFQNLDIPNWVSEIWFADNILIKNPLKLYNNAKSVALWGAVWDCAWISSFYKDNKTEVIWLTHAWYIGLKNKVIEQLIDSYKTLIWRENIKDIIFDISPLAGINYEFEKEYLLKLFKETFKEYDIDYIKDDIFRPYKHNKKRWYFMIWNLLKRILLENWIKEQQLNFNKDYTTDFNNKWPSYRLHSLSLKWLFQEKKIIPNARLWVFNIIKKTL